MKEATWRGVRPDWKRERHVLSWSLPHPEAHATGSYALLLLGSSRNGYPRPDGLVLGPQENGLRNALAEKCYHFTVQTTVSHCGESSDPALMGNADIYRHSYTFMHTCSHT